MPGVTYTERTVTQTDYQGGMALGPPVRLLFGAIILNQPEFLSSFAAFTERTANATAYTEKTASSSTYVERSV